MASVTVDFEEDILKPIKQLKEEITDLHPDDSNLGDKTWSSKHLVDMVCPELEESGNPVQCYPVEGYPLGLKIGWEPVQDGEGEPYPAGMGKNLFNPEWMPEKRESNGATWTITKDGVVTVDGEPKGGERKTYYNSKMFMLEPATYTISQMDRIRMSIQDKDKKTIAAQLEGKPLTFSIDKEMECSLFFAGAGIFSNYSVKPQIEKGTEATAYEPYSNIRPIKGRDSIKIERCGENLCSCIWKSKIENGITWTVNQDSSISVKGTATERTHMKIFENLKKKSLPDGVYTLWMNAILPDGIYCLVGHYKYKNSKDLEYKGNLMRIGGGKESCTANIANVGYLDGYINVSKGAVVDTTLYPMLIPGSKVPSEYVPYAGVSKEVVFPETIYGGEINEKGECRKIHKSIIFDGTEDWVLDKKSADGDITLYKKNLPGRSLNGNCSHFKKLAYKNIRPDNTIWEEGCYLQYSLSVVIATRIKTMSEWKEYLAEQYANGTPVQIVYECEKPEEIMVEPQQINALSGINTILTDADTLTVTGRADISQVIKELQDAVASMTPQEV